MVRPTGFEPVACGFGGDGTEVLTIDWIGTSGGAYIALY
jgi:hypothetical protein